MTLDEVLAGLFPGGHAISVEDDGTILGVATRKDGDPIAVFGIAHGTPLGPAHVVKLAQGVLDVVKSGGTRPILVLVDTASQEMSRRAERLGLNEYLAHLAKCLLLASRQGHRTIGLEYGKAAAGAFLATALATDTLVALPGAEPAVMDLPSIARVTKLPEAKLRELAESTPIFAPGLDHLVKTGAVAEVWDPGKPLDAQLAATLAAVSPVDERDKRGAERAGRKLAADVAERVVAQATRTVATRAA